MSEAVNELNDLLKQTESAGNDEARTAANSIARSIDVDASSFEGRERDALPSLTGAAAYYQLNQNERNGVLKYTAETFGENSKFFQQIQGVAALQLVQPQWYKTNLSNEELKDNAVLWGVIKKIVNIIGLATGSSFGANYVARGGSKNGENIMRRDWTQIKERFLKGGQMPPRQIRILGMASAGLFLAAIAKIANVEADAMINEIHNRIERGQMTWDDNREVEQRITDALQPDMWKK